VVVSWLWGDVFFLMQIGYFIGVILLVVDENKRRD
jgi:hypothetical protein